MKANISRETRLATIASIITRHHIGNQDELIKKLKESGIETTQATLSRDLKALQVVKAPIGDSYRYGIGHSHKGPVRGSAESIVSIDATDKLAVIKTLPGFAGAIALTIDNNVISHDLMGTIAGDDTILLILRKESALPEILEEAEHFIPGIRKKLI